MQRSALQSCSRWFFCFFLTAVVSGCADLKDVQDFSRQSAAITASKEALEYEQTWGERKQEYQHVFDSLASREAAEAKKNKTTFKLKTSASLPAEIKYDADQKKAITSLQSALSKYMVQLSELAGDDVVNISSNVKELVENLDNLPVNEDDKQERAKRNAAYGAIIELIELPLEAWRQRELRNVIVENNENIKILTEVLAEITRNIGHRIRLEAGTTYLWYDNAAMAFPSGSLDEALGERIAQRKLMEADFAKADAAIAAADAIEKFGTIHGQMAKDLGSFNSTSMKNLIANVKAAKDQVESARKQYQDAFGK